MTFSLWWLVVIGFAVAMLSKRVRTVTILVSLLLLQIVVYWFKLAWVYARDRFETWRRGPPQRPMRPPQIRKSSDFKSNVAPIE